MNIDLTTAEVSDIIMVEKSRVSAERAEDIIKS